MSGVEGLDWLELAAFQLTRVHGFRERGAPAVDTLHAWRTKQAPPWRRPALPAGELCERAEDLLAGESWALGSLRHAATETLEEDAGIWSLPSSWSRTTFLRWRLPTGTLHAAAIASADVDPPAHSLHPQSDDALRAALNEGAGDMHVHVGAVLSFDVLFALLMERLLHDPRRLDSVAIDAFKDSANEPFDPRAALAIGAVITSLLTRYDRAAAGTTFSEVVADRAKSDEAARAVSSGSTWSYLRRPIASWSEPRYATYADWFVIEPTPESIREATDPLWTATVREASWIRRSRHDPNVATAITELLRCKGLFHHALSQGSKKGLGEFLVSSTRLRPLRKLAAESKRDVVRLGLPSLGRGCALTGVELRTSEQSGSDYQAVSTELASSLNEQFLGYEDFRANGGSTVATWPICFIRDRRANLALDAGTLTASSVGFGSERPIPSLSVEGGRKVRFDFEDIWALSRALVKLLQAVPRAWTALPGFDVAGDEEALPSWIFALVFRTIATHLPAEAHTRSMLFRVHAGESYASPIEGLRRVNEAVMLVTPRDVRPRIGHGLALAAPSWSVERLIGQPADEALDDLVWLWSELRALGSTGSLVRRLESAILDASRVLYALSSGDAPTAPELAEAYRRRFEEDHLRRLGVLREGIENWPLLTLTVEEDAADDWVDEILVRYLTDTGLRKTVGEPLIDETWLRQAYEEVQPVVLTRVLDRNAIIEACPTSNLVIGGLEGYSAHPMVELLRQGVDVTISTDDPGLFGITLLDEYALMWPAFAGPTRPGPDRVALLNAIRVRSTELVQELQDPVDGITRLREHWLATGALSRASS